MNYIKKFILLSFVALVGLTSCSDDDPIVPDYSTYSFNVLPTDVELEGPDYSYDVTLNRSTSTQEDLLDLEISDASGKFVLASASVSFAVGESSKTITVEPMDASDVSIYETYNITVSVVVPAGTPSISKSVEASVAVNWVSAGDGNIDYGWAFAAPVYGSASKAVSLEKDSNVMLYKAKDLYAVGYDVEFAIVDGAVVIDSDQRMFETDPVLLGAQYIMIMQNPTGVYDATAKTVTLTYDMANENPSGANLPDNFRLGIVDVITLP